MHSGYRRTLLDCCSHTRYLFFTLEKAVKGETPLYVVFPTRIGSDRGKSQSMIMQCYLLNLPRYLDTQQSPREKLRQTATIARVA